MTYLCYKAFLYRIELVYFMENYNMDLNEIGSWASIIGLIITLFTFFMDSNVNKKSMKY